ncbi:MAG: hypothetical protein NTX49_02100 [Chlamydiae bacterium]|nr:hypothetical protein [Chlamydiota bacterium]
MIVNVGARSQFFPVDIDEKSTIDDLIKKISSLPQLSDLVVQGLMVDGNNLIKGDTSRKVNQVLDGRPIQALTVPRILPNTWVSIAFTSSDVGRLCPLKPVGTTQSTQYYAILYSNWCKYTNEEKGDILAQLTARLEEKIHCEHVSLKFCTGDNYLIFYLEEQLSILMGLAGLSTQTMLQEIGHSAISDPEMLSIVHIMFGDIMGLGTDPAQVSLTKRGEKIWEEYRRLVSQ